MGVSTRARARLATGPSEIKYEGPTRRSVMAKRHSSQSSDLSTGHTVRATVDELLTTALDRGGHTLETGRSIVTFQSVQEGVQLLTGQGVRVADARDFRDQAVVLEDAGDADAVVFPEIGAAVMGGGVLEARGLSDLADPAIESIQPEYFVFAHADDSAYLRGFRRAAAAIADDLRATEEEETEPAEDPLVLGATWGLIACKVPPSLRSGAGMKVAVLDSLMDLKHPDFALRTIVTQGFGGIPVTGPLNAHATHIVGTACGPKTPAGAIPRYGIGYKTLIHLGLVLTSTGSGTTATVLAGMNWAIANRCPVILLALGSASPVQAAYTAAGSAALNKGCLMIAAAGHSGGATGAPANSPTIMSVASLDKTLVPSAFSNVGKIEIAAPGRDIFSSIPRPTLYGIQSGTSAAAAHVAGCAALWAETNPTLRGASLWKKLQVTAKHLPFPPARVGAGLVQAP
jgi:subtilisin